MKIPLLLQATPKRGLIGPKVPVDFGKWRVVSDLDDSIVHIQYDSPQKGGFIVLNDKRFETEEKITMFALFSEVGSEKSVSVYLEKV